MDLTGKVTHKRVYSFECYDKNGNLKWTDTVENLTTNEGLDEILDKFWKGSAYTAQHYLGLTNGTPVFAAGDTLASKAWAEETGYASATRPDLTANWGTVSGQSLASSAISFSINATATIGGAFIATTNDKGGTTGILIGGDAFTGGNKSVANGDTLNVTVTNTEASA